MKQWRQRIRSAFGKGLIWAAAWFGSGILLARVSSIYVDLPYALLFAPFGFVAGIIFSGALVVLESHRRSEHMSLSNFAGWGAVSGLLLSGIFLVAEALGAETLEGEVLVLGPVLALTGSVCAAGLLTMFRRA